MLPSREEQLNRARNRFLISDILQKNDVNDNNNDNDVDDDDDIIDDDDDDDDGDKAEDLTFKSRSTTTTCATTILPRKARKARTAFSDSQLQSLVRTFITFSNHKYARLDINSSL